MDSMLIPPKNLVKYWRIAPKGVLHVGAHTGEEYDDYKQMKFGEIFWVEADPTLCISLKERFGKENVFNGLVWSTSNIVKNFYHSDNMQAASILAPMDHTTIYPDIHFTDTSSYTTTTLSDLIPESAKFNFLNLDIQGAELEALKGCGELLDQIQYIYTEVFTLELYQDNGYIHEVDQYLHGKGFTRVGANINSKMGWGDALYVKIVDFGALKRISLKYGTFRFYYDLRLKHANRRIRNRIRKMLFSIVEFFKHL